MRSRRLAVPLLSVCTAALLALTACGGNAERSAEGPNGAPTELAISVTGNWVTSYAPLWAAAPELAEIEKKYDTTITYPSFGKGNDALTAVLGGAAQICNCSYNTGLKAALAKDELRYVVNMFDGAGTVAIGAKKFEAERGTDLAKYDGGNWGYTSEGSLSQINLRAAAEHAGLDWANQKGIATGSIAASQPALQSGRVDIAMMDVASAAKSVHDGDGYPVLNSNDLTAFGPVTGTVIGNGLIMTKEFQDTYPALSQDLVTAVVAGLNRVRAETDPTKLLAMMPEGFQEAHADAAVFDVEWAFTQPSFLPTDGSTSEQAVKDTTAGGDFTEAELSSPAATSFVDNSMVDKAYQQLGIPRPTLQAAPAS
ncbi:ABC transporter substrate-binding protein [Pseudonocardia halophobica]|uniref:ABC transporter substrate-binding protein n=1 Tax=Pseudonocardia halophobica TaxID=29401 RepID=UPI003D92D438